MYHLVARLGNGLPIFIHTRMIAHETVRGERATVHEVVRAWRDVVVSFRILVFDSYRADGVSSVRHVSVQGDFTTAKFNSLL